MGDISDLPGIPEPILLLLREAGVETPELLVSLEVGEILIRLDEAHERRGLEVRRPPAELIRAWQMTAREVLRKRAEDPVPDAVEVSPTSLEEAGIDLNAIPVAQLLEPPPPEPPEETWSPPPSAPLQLDEPLPVVPPVPGLETRREVMGVEEAAVKPPQGGFEEVSGIPEESSAGGEAPASPGKEEKAPPVAFKPLEEASAARMKGERRNRGMSHPEAGLVRWSATVTVMSFLCSCLAIGALAAVGVMAAFFEARFHGSIGLLLLVIPGCLFIYVTQGTKARCRLCGQRLFVPKNCRKHERASRSILGYTFAVARSAMFRANFRCMLCGTKTRLKD